MKSEVRVFEQTLRHGNFIVRDHHVHGVRTLPGVTLLDMVYRLAPRCLGAEDAVELRKVIFKQPIVTSDTIDRQIVITFSPIDTHWQVSVASYGTRGDERLDSAMTTNMECTLHRNQTDGPVRTLNIDAFIRDAEYEVDMEQVYGLAKRANIHHYEFMTTLGKVYARGSHELMRLRLSTEAEAFRDKFIAHPALLDGSTFAGQSIRVRQLAFDDDRTPYIPFTINRFRIYRPFPTEIFTYSDNEIFWRRASGSIPDINATDIAVFDRTGELLAEFDKVSMKRIRSADAITGLLALGQSHTVTAQRKALEAARPAPIGVSANVGDDAVAIAEQPSLAAFIQQKIATALHQQPDEVSLTDDFYDLGMDSSQLLQLTRQVETAIGRELYPTLLFEYSSIEKLVDHLGNEPPVADMHPGGSDDYKRHEPAASAETDSFLLVFSPVQVDRALRASHGQPQLPRHIVFVADGPPGAWESAMSSARPPSANVEEVVIIRPVGAAVADRAEDMVERLVCYIKELVSRQIGRELVLQLVASADAGRSWATACTGCLRTLSLEHPRIRSQVFLIDDLVRQSPDRVAAMLQQEGAAAPSGTLKVTYSHALTQRRVSVLQEAKYNVATDAFPLRERGTYVIAGGLGALGLIVADHLASRIRPRLALLGRSALNAEGERHIERLARKGAEVMYFQVDLTDLGMLEKVYAQIHERLGPVAGIIHSAGTVKDQVIGRKNIEDVRCVIGSKVTGLWNLDQVSKHERLDFFLMFSSLSAMTGNIGQVDYAAANSFMDEFAFHRRDLELSGARDGRTVSFNWPLWAQGGMGIGGDIERLLYQSSGLYPLPAAVGMEIMEWALRNGEPQTVVVYGDASKIRGFMTSQGLISTPHGDEAARPAPDDETTAPQKLQTDAIAIIGLAGRYPLANDVEAFYRNLKSGKNCISSMPLKRWAGHNFGYDLDAYYQYGGFLDRIDEFDPQLFGIPPVRAQFMDPQARLFLETAWHACEDAGFYQDRKSQHYRASSEMSVGVFVGAFWSHYELFAAENTVRGVPTSLGVSLSSISNTTSYCMNFHGPSVAVDTMCSSALTAIHMACESLRSGECHYAVAGGVNLVAHPHKFIFLKENHFLSSHGECRSFGADGDGYVPGEGVGAVLLTSLDRAQKMGYPIRAIIRGTAVNHSGKTAGGTVPSPVAQSEVIADALTAAAVDPRSLGYVEAHGTGTSLGDPIEIEGLTKAFGRWTGDRQFCAIGSSKSNIGHLEAAAGIAGMTKLILQLEHGEIFPSLHAETLNPLIPFEASPFYVETRLRPWERPRTQGVESNATSARRALISAFGASGSNASLVVEEYVTPDRGDGPAGEPLGRTVAIVLSARDPDRLIELVRRLRDSIRQGSFSAAQLPGIAYTLQVGREPMDERLALAVRSLSELEQKLTAFLADPAAPQDMYRGKASRKAGATLTPSCTSGMTGDPDDRYAELLARWVEGANIDWHQLYGVHKPKRVHLPGYPFARQRYWVPDTTPSPVGTPSAAVAHSTSGTIVDAGVVSPLRRPPGKVSLAPLLGGAGGVSFPAGPVEAPVQLDNPLAAIQQSLVTSLAKALFMAPAEIDSDVPFPEVGLDSITAVQWTKAINAEFGTSFRAQTMHQYPTVGLLARHLQSELAHGAGAPTSSPAAADPPPSVRAVASAGLTVNFLRHSLATVLFMEYEQVDENTVFTDYGLDSIIAIQWIKAVNAEYGTSIKASVLYEHPTISALDQYLLGQMANAPLQDGPTERERQEARTTTSNSVQDQVVVRPANSESHTLAADLAYALAGCRHTDVTLVEVSPGCRFEVVAAGRGSPVVLLPPMGTLATAWMHQIRALSEHNRVLVFHYPGHGNTPFDKYGATFEGIAAGVRSAMTRFGIQERMHLVGWSMGALVAQTIALQSPERLRSLTLVGAPARVSHSDAAITGLGNLMKDFAQNVPQAARDKRESHFDFIGASSFMPRISIPYLEETLSFDYARAAEISVPTLVVFGSADQVISPEHGVALAAMIRNSRSHKHDHGGHYIPLQNHTWFNARLIEFFQEVGGQTNVATAEHVSG